VTRAWLSIVVACVAGASISCLGDVVQSNGVSALGEDPTGMRNGPLHRAGQPCLVCHGGQGPANAQFSVAGTIYRSHDVATGVNGVNVTLTDSIGNSITALTNDVGNFYLTPKQFTPTYPVRVTIQYLTVTTPMLTHIGREGSCATCHLDPEGLNSAGHIFVVGSDSDFPGG